MFHEIWPFFQNAAKFYIFPAKYVVSYLPPSVPRFASHACGARLMRFCSRLQCLDLSRTLFETFWRRCIPPPKFIHTRVISRNIDITVNQTVGIRAEWRLSGKRYLSLIAAAHGGRKH